MATQQPASAPWTDAKRYGWLLGALTITLPIVSALQALSTGWPIFWWFGPLFAFGVIPILDVLIGSDKANPPEAAVAALERDRYYRYVVYLATTVSGCIASAWRLEKTRLARGGRPCWSWHNEVLHGWAMTAALWGVAIAWCGVTVIPFLLIQAAYGVSLLEVVDYVEHYGLGRKRLSSGRYERCTPQHSWNSNYVVTNLFPYQLQRHADHHANPTRSYQALRHFDDSPQLPAGLCNDDPARLCAAVVVPRDESARGRALRREHRAIEHQAIDPAQGAR